MSRCESCPALLAGVSDLSVSALVGSCQFVHEESLSRRLQGLMQCLMQSFANASKIKPLHHYIMILYSLILYSGNTRTVRSRSPRE
jgi:hypothetical protein